MNERTKEFAGKALDKAVPYTWTQLDYDQIQELLACHTELIVRECATIASYPLGPTDAAYCHARVLEHFGVEE
jgi:hypothetical protein